MTRVACVGDSITYGGGNKTSSYPAILQTKFDQSGKKGKFTVKNYGVDGLMASPRQGCGLTSHENYIKSKAFLPNIVVIMLGTNDAKYIGENSPLYKDDMKSIIKAFQDLPSKPKIYIATSPRAHDVGNKGPGRDWASAINEKIVPLQRELAKELDLPLIDVNEYTKDMKAKVSDGIHGPYPDIAECIFKGISE
ncbi:MAG: GDSL-type esterase/lipase family protein [Oscillospiraceae bacterium]